MTAHRATSVFASFRFSPDVISVAVRWYLRHGLSYRDVEELLAERGITVDHVTIYWWVQRFTPEFVEAARACRHVPEDRWFADETYLKIAGRWSYLYRAVDQHGQVIDVLLSVRRDLGAARRFCTRALRAGAIPAEVTTDRAHVYPRVLDELIPSALHTVEQYANNPVEADHGRRDPAPADARTETPPLSADPRRRSRLRAEPCAAATTTSPLTPPADTGSASLSTTWHSPSDQRSIPITLRRVQRWHNATAPPAPASPSSCTATCTATTNCGTSAGSGCASSPTSRPAAQLKPSTTCASSPLSARASTSSSPPPPTTPVAHASTSISIGSWPGTYAPPSATRCGERPAHPRHACPTPTDRWHHHLT